MWKKFKNSFMYEMGTVGLACLVFSLVLPTKFDIRDMQMCLFLTMIVHPFAFFTFELKLFSGHLWVRRGIVIIFSSFFCIGMLLLFGILSAENWQKTLSILIPVFALIIPIMIFVYYVSDKIEKRNLEAINQKLEDNQTHSEK